MVLSPVHLDLPLAQDAPSRLDCHLCPYISEIVKEQTNENCHSAGKTVY